MKYTITINSASTVEEIPGYWSADDYIQLLEKFNYPDAEKADKNTLEELLLMAITDYEPNEAAAIVLEYKLSGSLSNNQIQQVSNDMLLDKISEEYPDISLHATLFHINQLLFKAFNGKFPNTKATLIDCTVEPSEDAANNEFTKEKMLKLLSAGLSDQTLIKRLFSGPLTENKTFSEADSILWEMKTSDYKNFTLITSEYWISKEEINADQFEAQYIEIVEAG